ncbi:helix-turn-helix domain-containing protein [Calycomorphotria hydatis]|uniref:Helix-turn-helix domain protein n=1 Tax=Calycomorphotria hydatis TaxID=2528027 RepID=A0A517TDC5_9PLAN|nr:Helix-turn-helix domain protein [Calycomorphotria hydatis]
MADEILLSVTQVAERLNTRRQTVLAYIGSGDLVAIDISAVPGGRPTWRVHPDDLLGFISRRTNSKQIGRNPRKKNKDIKEFF